MMNVVSFVDLEAPGQYDLPAWFQFLGQMFEQVRWEFRSTQYKRTSIWQTGSS